MKICPFRQVWSEPCSIQKQCHKDVFLEWINGEIKKSIFIYEGQNLHLNLYMRAVLGSHATLARFMKWTSEDDRSKTNTVEFIFSWENYQTHKYIIKHSPATTFHPLKSQGGRTWQPFGERKNRHKSFCQPRICYFRDKCVVFARNRKFVNLTQYNMQPKLCNSALLTQETLFLTQKAHFSQRFPKSA